MTPEEFADKMRALAKGAEGGHVDADHLMCELLRALGYGVGIDIFEKTPKWYA